MVVTSKHRTHKVMEAAIRELMGAGTPPRFKFKDTYASIEFPSGYTIPAQATLEAKYDELLALEEGIQKTVMEGDLEVGTSNLFVDTETGNVGIGTTNPAYTLDVHGSSNVGALTTTSVSGDGSGLSALNASNLASGTVPSARLSLAASDIPSLDAGKITTGTLTRPISTTTGTFSGDVGIGTTNPDYKLHIRSGTATALLLESDNGGTGYPVNIDFRNYDAQDPPGARISVIDDADYGSDITFNTKTGSPGTGSLSQRMIIQGDGNVGIGTTSPDTDLHIYGSTSQTNIFLGETGTPDKAGIIKYFQGDNSSNPGRLAFGSWGDDFSTGASTMCIKKGGFVGIGTTSPMNKLDVRSDNYATFGKATYNAAGWSGIRLGTPYTTNHDAYCSVIESYNNHASDYNSILRFKTSNGNNAAATERMRITAAGNVGIGASSPSYKLDVAGTSNAATYYQNGVELYAQRRWEVDLTGQSTSNFYPVELKAPTYEGSPDLPDMFPVHFKVVGESLGGGNSYNESTLVGYARGGGWSDHRHMYDVHYRRYDGSEKRFEGVYRGTQDYGGGIVIYMRGGYRYSVLTDATEVNTYTSAQTLDNAVFAIKNVSGADVSGTSTAIGRIAHIAGTNEGEKRIMSGNLDVNGYALSDNPAFYAWDNVSSYTLSSSDDYTVHFDSTTYNIGSHYNTSNNRFTCPVAGTYIFAAVIAHDTAGALNGSVYFSFYVNGVNKRDICEGLGAHTAHMEQHAVYITQLAKGDHVDVRSRSNSAINFVNGNHGAYYRNCFQGALLG